MTTVTAPQTSLPDFEHEYHTITVDTIGQASKNTFTVHLQQTLENIFQVKLNAFQFDVNKVSSVVTVANVTHGRYILLCVNRPLILENMFTTWIQFNCHM